MQPSRIFWWEREVPKGWQSELERAFPKSEKVSWLKIVWLAGTPEAPIQRWGIYQMVPRPRTTPLVLEDSTTRLPELCTRERPAFCYPAMVPWQQKLVRETGQFGMLYWIIQGAHGGHRWMLDETEIKVVEANGGKGDTPKPGALPYAEFDIRVLNMIAQKDRIASYKGIVAFYDRNPAALEAEDAAAVQEMRKEMWRWLDTQVEEVVDENAAEWREWAKDAPRRETEMDYEAMEEQYITAV
jgi:hypothetical protein